MRWCGVGTPVYPRLSHFYQCLKRERTFILNRQASFNKQLVAMNFSLSVSLTHTLFIYLSHHLSLNLCLFLSSHFYPSLLSGGWKGQV